LKTDRSPQKTDRSPKVSAVIIAKDEEDRIEPCLRSLVGWVDEIIVVDSGSEDRTVEVCRRYTPDVIETHWRGYGKQKQFAIEAASHEWVLSIDADEVVSPELREEIARVLASDPNVAAFRIPREYEVFGKTLRHGDCGRAPIRLFRRDRARFSEDEVHEKVIADGRIGRLRSKLIHYSIRDMDHAFAKMREYAKLWAIQRHRRGRRVNLFQCCVHSAWCFFDVLVLRNGWLDGRQGFVLAVLQSQYTFNKYVTLWSMGIEAAKEPVGLLHAIEKVGPETTTTVTPISGDASLRGANLDDSLEPDDVPVGRAVR
jgi:glycosyltransferase involved in cell wall biosynthesis